MFAWFRKLFEKKCPHCSEVMEKPHRAVLAPAESLNPNRKIARVWIEQGCVICNACETTCPSVFTVSEETASIRPGGKQLFESLRDQIEEAHDGCCVEVIKIEYADGSRRPEPNVTCDHGRCET
jgi:ferredoxin